MYVIQVALVHSVTLSEISEFEFQILIHQHIAWFDIRVDKIKGMKSIECD